MTRRIERAQQKAQNIVSSAKGKVAVVAAAGVAMATNANAAIDPSLITLDTGPVEVLGLTVLGALALIWTARKVVGFLGR